MTEHVTLAGGCFWCTEAVFKDVIGVESVESGYVGGHVADPTYKEVCGGATGHAEAIRIGYDPSSLALDDLLDIFFATHDATQLNRQGNDVGTQYRSAMFPDTPEQDAAMRAAMERAGAASPKPIVTTIETPADEIARTWYTAEGYHQDYWETSGRSNPYCMAVIPPKLQKLRKSFAARSKAVAA